MRISLKQKIIGAVIAIGLILIAIFQFGLGGNSISVVNNSKNESTPSNDPQLISTNPPELFEKKPMIFTPTQSIELNFNVALENGPETKLVIEPAANVNVEVINDGKTAKITPITPYTLGQAYTIHITPEAKLKGGGTLNKNYDLQFNVINYQGV